MAWCDSHGDIPSTYLRLELPSFCTPFNCWDAPLATEQLTGWMLKYHHLQSLVMIQWFTDLPFMAKFWCGRCHFSRAVRVCECWHWKDISSANCINLPGYTGENSTKSKGNYASAFWSQIVRIAFPIIPDVQPDTNTYTHVHLHLSTGMDIFDPCWYDHVCISGLKQPGYPMDPSSMYKLKGAIPGDDLRKSHHSDPRSQLLAQSWPDPRDLPLGVDWNCGLLMFLNMEAIRTPHHIQSPSIPFTLVIKIGMWMFIHPFIQEINEHHGFWHIPNSFYVCFDTVPVSAKHGQGILCRSGLCKNLSNHRCQPQR